jgi:uncharacterized membrane protein (UPF0127 family)
VCESFACRLRGLMFRSSLPRDRGLLLIMPRESRLDASIHMLFVPFDLAVFWISSGKEVVDKTTARSWRPAYIPSRAARYVLEVHPDHIDAYDIGHKVEFRHV